MLSSIQFLFFDFELALGYSNKPLTSGDLVRCSPEFSLCWFYSSGKSVGLSYLPKLL